MTINAERYVDRARPLRRTDIARHDPYPHGVALLGVLRPLAFQHAIAAAVEIGILREMVEAVRGAVEAHSDIMAAIVG